MNEIFQESTVTKMYKNDRTCKLLLIDKLNV